MNDRPEYGYGIQDPSAGGGGTSDGSSLPPAAPGGDGLQPPASPGGGGARPPIPPGPDGDVPVCPRHPDRPSYVRCKRCGRPACGECQRPAAVGMLCVDCDRDLSRQQANSRPRNAMGGRSGGKFTPYVTYGIMAICIVFFLIQNLAPQIASSLLIYAPFRTLAMPWTMLTSGFLHGGIMHLVLNMWALWAIGQYLEHQLGRGRYAGLFLASVVAGHTAVLLVADPTGAAWVSGTVGASGGIFGLFGAMFVVNRRMGAQTTQVLVLIALNLLITFTVPGISWQGHLGGLIMGTGLAAAMFATRPKATPGADRAELARRSTLIHSAVIAGGFLLCIVLIVVKAALVPDGYLPLLGP
jgi:membrane associated rhomboid family serine protease